jgi:hypothetical protein
VAISLGKLAAFFLFQFASRCYLMQDLLFLLFQEKSLTGKNNPLPGVSVVLKGTNKGTTTSSDGSFQFADVPENGVLVFSYTGYASQEISVKGKTTIDIALTEIVSSLNEVVVTGYGTCQEKRSDRSYCTSKSLSI